MLAQSETLFFIHLPKTGGLTVTKHIHDILEHGEAYPVNLKAPSEQFRDIQGLLPVLRARQSPPRFISGHFPFHLADEFDFPVVTATVIRDPVDRVLSQLQMLADEDKALDAISFEEMYDNGYNFPLLLDNMQTKMLSATADDKMTTFFDLVRVDATRLERAKHNLRKVDLIGFQDNLEDFISQITDRFGWPRKPVESINISPQKRDVSASFKQRIAEDCRFDYELQAYARGLVQERSEGQRIG